MVNYQEPNYGEVNKISKKYVNKLSKDFGLSPKLIRHMAVRLHSPEARKLAEETKVEAENIRRAFEDARRIPLELLLSRVLI